MSDTTPTPVADTPAPSPEPQGTTDDITQAGDNPVHSETMAPEPIAKTVKPSVTDSLKSAMAKVEAGEKAKLGVDPKAAEAKTADPKATDPKAVDPKAPVAKAPDQKAVDQKAAEAAKPRTPIDPPARWTPEAKTKWATVDDTVKGEVDRTIKELERGHEKYKEAATKYEALKEYDELAKTHKTDLKTALDQYTALERNLTSDDNSKKIAAIEEVFRVAKVSPKEYAAYVMGQTPDQNASKSDATIRQLQQKVSQLTEQVNGVSGNFESQQREQVQQQLVQWAQDKPLADELSNEIVQYMQQGLSLDEAYAKTYDEFQAKALRAGFTIPDNSTQALEPDLVAQTPKGRKSITGAPGAGSYPATQKPSKSVEDAVKRAFGIVLG